MWKYIKIIFVLALLFLVIAPILLIIESRYMDVPTGAIAQNIILLSILFFTFTMIEIGVLGKMKSSESTYYIGANIGFSFFRLLMTIAILLIYKQQDNIDFTLVFINVLVFYFLTLLFSTWRKHKQNKSLGHTYEPQS